MQEKAMTEPICSHYSYTDYMTTDYRAAAETLWGKAGAFVHDSYAEHRDLFPNLPEQLPIVIGIAAYGKCAGLTRGNDPALDSPRISVASNLFKQGLRRVDDLMIHEMLHVSLVLAGKESDHNTRDWYDSIRKLSPEVLGHGIDVAYGSDRKSIRVPRDGWTPESGKPKTKVVKERVASNHAKVAQWPNGFRPDGYDWGRVIYCPTY